MFIFKLKYVKKGEKTNLKNHRFISLLPDAFSKAFGILLAIGWVF